MVSNIQFFFFKFAELCKAAKCVFIDRHSSDAALNTRKRSDRMC